MRLERHGGDAVVVVERLSGASRITQRITLAAGSPSLGISTEVDWQEREKLLKLGFPLDLRADRSAAETQFGHVFRPTHVNTSWEAAKFEICAHRWIHVAEPGYGVAIANASTYGHDVARTIRDDGGTTTTVRLSLLRAAKFPDPQADRGRHVLDVWIRPGAGIAEAVEEGYRANLAPRTVQGGHPVEPLVTRGQPGPGGRSREAGRGRLRRRHRAAVRIAGPTLRPDGSPPTSRPRESRPWTCSSGRSTRRAWWPGRTPRSSRCGRSSWSP